MTRLLRILAATSAALALAGAVHARHNARRLPRPEPTPETTCPDRIAVLIPARDEEGTIAGVVADALAVPDANLRVHVLDDDSGDATADRARAAAGSDPRFRLLIGADQPPPAGWLGKPWACRRLADAVLAEPMPGAPPGPQSDERTPTAAAPGPSAAPRPSAAPGAGCAPATGGSDADVLVFVDADVRLAPGAIRSAVTHLRRRNLDLLSPWPRQVTCTWAERLVHPLQQWSWLTTLPLDRLTTSPRPSLAAANGQFLVVDAAAYRRAGGHTAVRDMVLEDIGLARAMKRSGGRIGLADGSRLAQCRMYEDTGAMVAGYTKSLWAAFAPPGTPPALRLGLSLGTLAFLSLTYVLPPLIALAAPDPLSRALGVLGYLAGVDSRHTAARATGGRCWPDALAHPISVAGLDVLTALSLRRHARGELRWKGRSIAG